MKDTINDVVADILNKILSLAQEDVTSINKESNKAPFYVSFRNIDRSLMSVAYHREINNNEEMSTENKIQLGNICMKDATLLMSVLKEKGITLDIMPILIFEKHDEKKD